MRGGLLTQGDFGPVYAINPRAATGRFAAQDDFIAGQEAEFHEAAGQVFGQVKAVEYAALTGA